MLRAPSPSVGSATSTCPNGSPPSLVTLPVMVTGSWAYARTATRLAMAVAANQPRTIKRMMGPPAVTGWEGLLNSRHATDPGAGGRRSPGHDP